MLFIQLLNSSFKRNLQVYGPYLLATSMIVAINYIFAAISANQSLKSLGTGAVTGSLLKMGSTFIILVTAAFLLYVNRFLWQQRSQEIGLYSMLGMTSKNLALLTVLEKCYLLVISLVAGLTTGVIFEKLAFLGLNRLLEIGKLHQPWAVPSALVKTAGLIAVFFTILMVIDLIKIHLMKPTSLWHASATVPKHHGAMFSLAGGLGIAMLAGAYYITLTTKPKITALNHFMLAVILVVIGTYLLFIAGSVLLLNWLRHRSNFYYRPRHFIAISGMRQRMEQNGAALATICLLCTAVLVILFTALTLYTGIQNTVRSYTPTDMTIVTNQPLSSAQRQVIKHTAADHHAKLSQLTSYQATTAQFGYWEGQRFVNQGALSKMNTDTSSALIMVNATTYQRLTGNHPHLTAKQALLYSPAKPRAGKLAVNGQTYQTKAIHRLSFAFNPDHSIYTPAFMVVKQLPQGLPTMSVTSFNYQLASTKKRLAFEAALQQSLGLPNPQVTGQTTITALLKQMYGGLVFVGILISLALGITTTIVIYFKQISEGYTDQQRFTTMQQVGLSERETTKSIHSQVLMVFMLPIAGAIVNLLFALPAIRQIMIQLSFYNQRAMVIIAGAITLALLALYLVIYGLTTRIYHQIVEKR